VRAASEWPQLLAFLRLVGKLKQLRRKGWVDRGVHEPESVADHSFRLALLAWIVGQSVAGADPARMALLALVHDLPEALAGDRTPFDDALAAGADRTTLFRQPPPQDAAATAAKSHAERVALQEMTALLPPSLAEALRSLWEEYEAGATLEAQLVRQLDKLETALQALEYRETQSELVIDSFVLGLADVVVHPALQDAVTALRATWKAGSTS
jgi:putative hydrolase of HD superfamily